MNLFRADVEIIDKAIHRDDLDVSWTVRIAGLEYCVTAWPNYLGDGRPATAAMPIGDGHGDVYSPSAIHAESLVDARDHWACIDQLLAWLSIKVEDGWSRPTLHISHRIDLEPVDLVAVFSVAGVHTIKLWTVRDLAAHFDACRGDDLGDDPLAVDGEHPASLYVRQDGELVAATYRRICHGDGDEIQVRVNGSVVAAARY